MRYKYSKNISKIGFSCSLPQGYGSYDHRKTDDTGEIGLYGIRTRFYLNAKKKEMDF